MRQTSVAARDKQRRYAIEPDRPGHAVTTRGRPRLCASIFSAPCARLPSRHSDILPRGRKARAMLGYLCLAGGAQVSRSRLATMLWDRVPQCQARVSFRQAFRELTVAFGPLSDDLLYADRDTVRLDTSACWIDTLALLSQEPGAGGVRSTLADLCRGELLEDLNGVSPAFDRGC